MKVQITPFSTGTKGVDWQRFYAVRVKTFLLWSNLQTFKTIDEAEDYVREFFSPRIITYEK